MFLQQIVHTIEVQRQFEQFNNIESMYETVEETGTSTDVPTVDTREKPEREEIWNWSLVFSLLALVISPVPIVYALHYFNKKEKNLIKGVKNEQ